MSINVVICGTPGTGKSTLIEKIKPQATDFNFINISKFAIDNDCIAEYDEKLETQVIDEEKLEEKLVPILESHRVNIIECIHADLVPEELVSWVFVCRTETTVLFDRLSERDYSEAKISNNMDSEIFQVVLDEAHDCFDTTIVTELNNTELGDLDRNCNEILNKARELQKLL